MTQLIVAESLVISMAAILLTIGRMRKLGHTSDFAIFRPSFFRFPADFVLKGERKDWTKTQRLFFLLRCLRDYDIFHFHSESIFAAENKDIPLLRRLGKRVIFHFHGSDIRGEKMNPLIKSAHARLVSTPDLLKYVPDGIWVPQAIDLEYWSPLPVQSPNKSLTVIHAPTHRKKKGTELIVSTIEDLKREGYQVELLLVEGQPYENLKPYYQKGDIFIDQIIIGAYGNFTVEGMALKKPVCVFVSDEVLSSYPEELPVMNTSADTLKRNLKRLIEDENLRKELGEKGRVYAEKYHDVRKVALKCLSIYRNC